MLVLTHEFLLYYTKYQNMVTIVKQTEKCVKSIHKTITYSKHDRIQWLQYNPTIGYSVWNPNLVPSEIFVSESDPRSILNAIRSDLK